MFIFDAHIDTLLRLLMTDQTLETSDGHVSLELLRRSRLGAQFFAAFVHPNCYHGLAQHSALRMVDLFWQIMDKYPDELCFAGSGGEIREARQSGRLACLLAIEGGEALEGSLSHLRNFHRLGVRLLTLTWNFRNDLASGQSEGPEGGGLSRFGREVVAEMNRLKMLVDVSHLNEPGFWDVVEIAEKPIIASHSNARALCDHPRNLTDKQIRAVADSGGVIGVNFYSRFLTSAEQAAPRHVVEHIDYLVNVGGLDCVGLGSDFDGISETPIGLENCSQTQLLAGLLAQRGYSEAEIAKIMGGNLLRLCDEVLG